MKKKTKINNLQHQGITPKVLVVDDDPTIRILLRTALARWGYQIIEAPDGEKAWEVLLMPDPPQLLLLDWIMPKLDGISLCKRIEEKLNFHPYTIFLTSKSGTENVIQGLESGADEFLLKPFDLSELRIRLFAGERIIRYRNQLANRTLELQNYVDSMKKTAEDHARDLIPFDDLAVVLLKIHNALYPICERLLENTEENKPAVDKIGDLQKELHRIIEIIRGIKTDTSQIHKISQGNIPIIETPHKPLIDMDRMHDFFGNDIAAIHDFIKTFITLSREQLNSIHTAISNKDEKNSRYYFHLLRGAAGNSGIMKMYEICGRGEDHVMSGNWDAANDLYLELSDILSQLQLEVTET